METQMNSSSWDKSHQHGEMQSDIATQALKGEAPSKQAGEGDQSPECSRTSQEGCCGQILESSQKPGPRALNAAPHGEGSGTQPRCLPMCRRVPSPHGTCLYIQLSEFTVCHTRSLIKHENASFVRGRKKPFLLE